MCGGGGCPRHSWSADDNCEGEPTAVRQVVRRLWVGLVRARALGDIRVGGGVCRNHGSAAMRDRTRPFAHIRRSANAFRHNRSVERRSTSRASGTCCALAAVHNMLRRMDHQADSRSHFDLYRVRLRPDTVVREGWVIDPSASGRGDCQVQGGSEGRQLRSVSQQAELGEKSGLSRPTIAGRG